MKKDFKILSEEYLLSLLNEAPGDPNAQQNQNTQQQNTTFSSSDPNATYEPTEQDADMGSEMDMGEDGMDDGMGDMSMDTGGNDGMSGGADPSMGGGMPTGNVKDIFKKRKLFNDYKKLLEAIDDLLSTTSIVQIKNLPDSAQKVYTFVNEKMEENKQKLLIILTEQYLQLSYQQLLTLYMYIKIATKSYADIVKQINSMYQ